MATPFNPFKNSFQSAYLDMTDEDPNSVFLPSSLRGQGSKGRPEIADILSNPIDPNYNADFGPTTLLAGLPKLEGFRASTQNYLSGIFSPPTSSTLSQESSTPLGNGSAQNSAQSAMKAQSNITSAFNAVQSLYDPMGGRPIAGSEDVRVKVDAYGRPFTTVSMTPTGSGGYESAADKANTNRLGQFQAKQVESQASSQAAASTPAAIQSEQNRQALIQSKISSIPQGASTTETQTPNGTNRMVSGSSGYAEALIPKKKQGMV